MTEWHSIQIFTYRLLGKDQYREQKFKCTLQLSYFLLFFTNVYLILKTSKCLKTGSKNTKAPGEMIHNNKYRHLGVLNSHSKRQTWACFKTWFAFSVNCETKSPSKKVVYSLTGEYKTRTTAVRHSPKLGKELKSFNNLCVTCFYHVN